MEKTMRCPYCDSSIPSDAKVCIYCDREIPADKGVRAFVRSQGPDAGHVGTEEKRTARPRIANGLAAILSQRAQGGGAEAAPDDLFLFSRSDGAGYIVYGIAGTVPADLEIPSAYRGKPVVEIGPEAFRGLQVARVCLPPSLRRIGCGAFRDCSLLYEVTGGDNIERIDREAFRGCCRLSRFPSLEAGGKSISHTSFAGCYQLGLAAESGCVPDE